MALENMSSSNMKTITPSMAGLRPSPRDNVLQIDTMNAEELRTFYNKNEELLRTLRASSSSFVSRIEANQTRIRERLAQLDGLASIQRGMQETTIGEEIPMSVDSRPEKQELSPMKVRKDAVTDWERTRQSISRGKVATLSVEEAIALEQQQNAIEQERRARAEAHREKMMMPTRNAGPNKTLSREEYEAKVWAFMSYKPTDSDLEGEDDDEDDDDPASWFHDEEDDGIKGQDIVYPDVEDLSDIIRIDEGKLHYSTFYEPRDEDF